MAEQHDIDKNGISYKVFSNLPETTQEAVFMQLNKGFTLFDLRQKANSIAKKCESPIELDFGFNLALITIHLKNFEILPQEWIETKNGKYRVDFLLISNGYKLIVECDGYEYHYATKEQVVKGNKRDMALKECGYDILHFSGTEIHEDVCECILNAVMYLLKKSGRINKDGTDNG